MAGGACTADRVAVASKGLEPGGGILTEAASAALNVSEVAALSGPNLARELAAGVPSVAVAASRSRQLALDVRRAFMGPSFRVYVTDDVIGVELAGALKNVMAIAAGMSDGLGYGANTKAALLARGLSEMTRIGVACGARTETFMGLAGVGDLFATASSELSRNYRLGRRLAEGLTLAEALERIGQVAEGAPAAEAAIALAQKHELPAPICEAVWSVIRGEASAKACVGRLMERTTLYENVGFGVPPFGGFEDA
jgi:glycerol-3-phosphate dehydrogenase (NAD(P)+)